jgi:hypothetical protein
MELIFFSRNGIRRAHLYARAAAITFYRYYM